MDLWVEPEEYPDQGFLVLSDFDKDADKDFAVTDADKDFVVADFDKGFVDMDAAGKDFVVAYFAHKDSGCCKMADQAADNSDRDLPGTVEYAAQGSAWQNNFLMFRRLT